MRGVLGYAVRVAQGSRMMAACFTSVYGFVS